MSKPNELIQVNNYITELMKQLKPVAVGESKPVKSSADYGYSGNKPLPRF